MKNSNRKQKGTQKSPPMYHWTYCYGTAGKTPAAGKNGFIKDFFDGETFVRSLADSYNTTNRSIKIRKAICWIEAGSSVPFVLTPYKLILDKDEAAIAVDIDQNASTIDTELAESVLAANINAAFQSRMLPPVIGKTLSAVDAAADDLIYFARTKFDFTSFLQKWFNLYAQNVQDQSGDLYDPRLGSYVTAGLDAVTVGVTVYFSIDYDIVDSTPKRLL